MNQIMQKNEIFDTTVIMILLIYNNYNYAIIILLCKIEILDTCTTAIMILLSCATKVSEGSRI